MPDDLLAAEKCLICFPQQERFRDDFSALSFGKCEGKEDSTICELAPVLDDRFLRVGGRLSKAAMLMETKHPIITKH